MGAFASPRPPAVLAALGLLSGCAGPPAPVEERSAPRAAPPPAIADSVPSGGDRDLSVRRGGPAGAAVQTGVHRVREGETLYSIAYRHDMDFRELARINGLSPPYTILVDQTLRLDAAPDAGAPAERSRAEAPRAPAAEPVWRWPHRGRILRPFQSGGDRGMDIAGRVGDPVLAAADGEVVYAGRGVQGSGNLIIIRHGERHLSTYAHNRAMLVEEGQTVRAGDRIGEVGRNAAGTAALRFDVRVDGRSVDPAALLP